MKTEISMNKTQLGYYFGEVLIFNDEGGVDGYIDTPDFDTEKEAYIFAKDIEVHLDEYIELTDEEREEKYMGDYDSYQLAKIDSIIRALAVEHYKYGKDYPLVYGKARGIAAVLRTFYNIETSVYYVWDVLREMYSEQNK